MHSVVPSNAVRNSLCLYPAGLQTPNLNPAPREVCGSVGFTRPAVSTKVAWRSVTLLDRRAASLPSTQWVEGAGDAFCSHDATCPVMYVGLECGRTDDAAAVNGCWAMLWHNPGQEAFANWTFWHVSFAPLGAQKINFLSGFTSGVFIQVLIMPSTEKNQTDAWRQWSSGSTAQNHLNPTTFV